MACPIWGTGANIEASSGDGDRLTSDRAGGGYRISGSAKSVLQTWNPSQKSKLTTWLIDQRRAGEQFPLINTEVLRVVDNRKALRFSDRKQRFFLWLSSADFRPDDAIQLSGVVGPSMIRDLAQMSAWIESRTDEETQQFANLLVEEGVLSKIGTTGRLKLTAKGFEYLESVEQAGAPTDQAFVAMWFSSELATAYDDGIEPAIIDAGYRPIRIDRLETNGKIDDEIIAEIRRSRFVVADFTCGVHGEGESRRPEPRGGVYYEAGFAQGLGTPVIWTVRDDCIDFVHFDTRQFAHIVWSDPADLRERLKNRILALLGEGPVRRAGIP